MSKIQRFVDEIITDRKLHPICEVCKHGKDQHAFDVYPMTNPNKPCEMSCMICFDEVTESLKAQEQNNRSVKE